MNLSKNLKFEIKEAIEKIRNGIPPEECVPRIWKLESNRSEVDAAYTDVCMCLWLEKGDTALNRTGYTNSMNDFWNEVIGKKDSQNTTDLIEHWDESWYF